MSERGQYVPEKLKKDAIIEAILELRFETSTQPEFLLVRLADVELFKGYSQSRLPAYNLPDAIRSVDPNLRFQPMFELLESTSQRSLRIGPNSLSYHLRSPYNGWEQFGGELRRIVDALFDKVEHLAVTRLGFRYLNALTPESHGISGIGDLDVELTIGKTPVKSAFNILVTTPITPHLSCTTRIVTPDFVMGSLPSGTSIIADVDVSTPEPFRTNSKDEVIKWIEDAHSVEKREFFALIKNETITKLVQY